MCPLLKTIPQIPHLLLSPICSRLPDCLLLWAMLASCGWPGKLAENNANSSFSLCWEQCSCWDVHCSMQNFWGLLTLGWCQWLSAAQWVQPRLSNPSVPVCIFHLSSAKVSPDLAGRDCFQSLYFIKGSLLSALLACSWWFVISRSSILCWFPLWTELFCFCFRDSWVLFESQADDRSHCEDLALQPF